MSRTDKTDPYWVKERSYGRVVHHCGVKRRYGLLVRECDFQDQYRNRRQMCDYELDSFEMQKAWTNIPAIKPYVKQDRRNKRRQEKKLLRKTRYEGGEYDVDEFRQDKRDAWYVLT